MLPTAERSEANKVPSAARLPERVQQSVYTYLNMLQKIVINILMGFKIVGVEYLQNPSSDYIRKYYIYK